MPKKPGIVKLMYESEYCEVSYNKEINIVLVKWKKFCYQNNYRQPLLAALDIMKQYKNCNYVADTRNGFENKEEDTEWLFREFLPKASLTNCKIIFFIINEDNKLKEELEGQSVELKKFFEVIYCFGLNEVKEILKQKTV